jgi:hypothetical protein
MQSSQRSGHGKLRIWDNIGNGLVDAAETLQVTAL